VSLGGCRTFGTSAVIRPQRFFFTVFLAHSYGYEPANPAKTALAGVEFGYAALRERFDAESPTAS